MSHSQNQANSYYSSNSSTNPTELNDLPPFQAFPAARDSRPRPNSGYSPPQQNPGTTSVAHGSSHRYKAADEESIHQPGHRSSKDLQQREQQRITTLPPFTPFPSASRDHRYAPPEGSRAEQARPITPPAYAAETSSSHLLAPPDAIRYPSGLPGQPSPYAPPGPLTARPHVCEHCDSGFARAHDLKRHLETHKSERPHKCPNCQRSFSRKDAVQRHLVVTQCAGPSSSK